MFSVYLNPGLKQNINIYKLNCNIILAYFSAALCLWSVQWSSVGVMEYSTWENRQQIWHWWKWQKNHNTHYGPRGLEFYIISSSKFYFTWIDPCVNNPCMELAPCCWWPWLFSATSPRPILFSWKTVEHCTLHRTIAAVLHNETGAALQHRSWLVLQTIYQWSCTITEKAPTTSVLW